MGRLRAGLYILRRGSKIAFSCGAAGEADLVESKVSEGRITFWFNGADALEVTIAGAEAQPVDQYEWLGGKREHS
ncbi:MAG: hypothetical protein AVDCRST_MAG93-7341 [uncultured Chloroflexia bacterium]|uniref:Uncharacterized protein n=1 Tax=uncultured Chloroflexia bacterium TaxID=1672391 RepID=A0A6J4MCF9_9CHLR|nr:MAG: hypothetical protein AVDCRST_MAG93-7341 [uncultured Chloroflexia bacterium]